MTTGQLWELFPIILKEHDPVYFIRYEAQRARLAELFCSIGIMTMPISCLPSNLYRSGAAAPFLCGEAVRISHIGSTAVPGLISKPTVDILLEIDKTANAAAVRETLIGDGWLLMSDIAHPAMRLSFNKGYTESGFAEEVYHLHITCCGDPDELYFRDYLIARPDVAAEYGRLKLTLLEKYRHDRDGYTAAKTEFIKAHTAAARKEFGGRYKIYALDKTLEHIYNVSDD